MRLPRVRKGTVSVDVNVVTTEVVRVRLTISKHGTPQQTLNTDLRENEVEDLITILQYKLAQARGQIT